MSFALTFGGFGDFVTLTQLILGTCQILINSFNATAECEDLIRYLSAFNNALETVRPLIRGEAHASINGGFPPSAINALRDAVKRCKDEIEQFEPTIVRLRDSDDRRLKARLGAIGQRLQWSYSLSQSAAKLRATLTEHKGIIDTVLTALLAQHFMFWDPTRNPHVGRAPASHGVTLIDMMEQVIIVPIEFSFSRKTFDNFLDALFADRAGAVYVKTKAYRLTVSHASAVGEEVSEENWDTITKRDAVLEMAVLAVRKRESEAQHACPTCRSNSSRFVDSREGRRCSWCQTIVTVEGQHFPELTAPEEEYDWKFMRRFHYIFTSEYLLLPRAFEREGYQPPILLSNGKPLKPSLRGTGWERRPNVAVDARQRTDEPTKIAWSPAYRHNPDYARSHQE